MKRGMKRDGWDTEKDQGLVGLKVPYSKPLAVFIKSPTLGNSKM
jgi:hypothetical protein